MRFAYCDKTVPRLHISKFWIICHSFYKWHLNLITKEGLSLGLSLCRGCTTLNVEQEGKA